jgi:hypothetical protein
MSKFGSFCYLPPPNIGHPLAFLQNIKNHPPRYPIVVYSDHDYRKEYPAAIKLAANPELFRVDTNKMAMQNLIFFVGLRIMASQGFSHVMCLEADCRVNTRHFDDILWNEFQRKNVNALAGGSMAIFNPCSFSEVASRRFERFLIETAPTRLVPLSVTGSSNLAEFRDSCVFPNGAFAIYKMDWWLKNFPQIIGKPEEYIELAKTSRTWDYLFGVKLWDEFKEKAYDQVVCLDNIYSGYGEVMTKEADRMSWLKEKKIVGVHQIKTDWPGPEAEPVQDLVPTSAITISETNINMEIFICTYAKDFQYLRYCLRSIKKFATGFSGTTILVPTKDVKELRSMLEEIGCDNKSWVNSFFTVKSGYEWAHKGMLWHLAQECRADEWCPNADYIAHIDADCIFTKPVKPQTFFKYNNPLLRYEPFETLAKRQPGTWNWKIAAENSLPFSVANEYMRGHPEVYHRGLYAKTRELVEQKTKQPFNDYIKSGRNEYPQQFCEYETLGAVAHQYFVDSYTLCDLSKEPHPDKNPYPVQQFWGHGELDKPQDIWVEGIKRNAIPIQMIEEILK